MDMLEKLLTEVNEEDFLIRVRPFADDDGAWSGEVDISIMAMPDNPLDDDDYYKVMHFAKMMCASVPVMEESEDLRDIVHEYVVNVLDNEMEIDVELEEEVGVEKTYDGNIVHINFNTKTGGSA
jgi:sulfate adenylyltransferase subunit 1 (EFTu-like GTPase family)